MAAGAVLLVVNVHMVAGQREKSLSVANYGHDGAVDLIERTHVEHVHVLAVQFEVVLNVVPAGVDQNASVLGAGKVDQSAVD